MLSIYMLVDYHLLRNFGPYGIIFMTACVYYITLSVILEEKHLGKQPQLSCITE
jgi:hypothetical protein